MGEDVMTIQELRALRATGKFHHATYQNGPSLWEGLWIYRKSEIGFRGFEPAGCFYKGDPDLDAAHRVIADTGVSLGSYGQG